MFQVHTGYGTFLTGVLISTAIVALLAYPGAHISANGSIVLMVCELSVVLALSATVFFVLLGRHKSTSRHSIHPERSTARTVCLAG